MILRGRLTRERWIKAKSRREVSKPAVCWLSLWKQFDRVAATTENQGWPGDPRGLAGRRAQGRRRDVCEHIAATCHPLDRTWTSRLHISRRSLARNTFDRFPVYETRVRSRWKSNCVINRADRDCRQKLLSSVVPVWLFAIDDNVVTVTERSRESAHWRRRRVRTDAVDFTTKWCHNDGLKELSCPCPVQPPLNPAVVWCW